jgi:hypothetical protein
MPKKSVETDQERMFDSKQGSSVAQAEVAEQPKKGWDFCFNNNSKEEKKACKKIRFKWVC